MLSTSLKIIHPTTHWQNNAMYWEAMLETAMVSSCLSIYLM